MPGGHAEQISITLKVGKDAEHRKLSHAADRSANTAECLIKLKTYGPMTQKFHFEGVCLGASYACVHKKQPRGFIAAACMIAPP